MRFFRGLRGTLLSPISPVSTGGKLDRHGRRPTDDLWIRQRDGHR